jgi:hypothetical protein
VKTIPARRELSSAQLQLFSSTDHADFTDWLCLKTRPCTDTPTFEAKP